jgi:hypothetical protein
MDDYERGFMLLAQAEVEHQQEQWEAGKRTA